MPTWQTLLDAYEADLERAERLLDHPGGTDPVGAWRPPDRIPDAPPTRADLRRFERLRQADADLRRRAAAALQGWGEELRHGQDRRVAARRYLEA